MNFHHIHVYLKFNSYAIFYIPFYSQKHISMFSKTGY